MYCAKCGKASFVNVHANQYQCRECEFTYFHNVAAAVSAIISLHGKVLFTRRAVDPGMGKLDLPGGFVDPGESLEQALLRELKEELSFEADKVNYLFSFANPYRYRKVEYHTLESVFEICLSAPPNFQTEKQEISEISWKIPAQIEQSELAFVSTKQAIAAYENRLKVL